MSKIDKYEFLCEELGLVNVSDQAEFLKVDTTTIYRWKKCIRGIPDMAIGFLSYAKEVRDAQPHVPREWQEDRELRQ